MMFSPADPLWHPPQPTSPAVQHMGIFLLGLPSSYRQANFLGRSFLKVFPHPSTAYSGPKGKLSTLALPHCGHADHALWASPYPVSRSNSPLHVPLMWKLNTDPYSPHFSNSRRCPSHSPKISLSTSCSGPMVALDPWASAAQQHSAQQAREEVEMLVSFPMRVCTHTGTLTLTLYEGFSWRLLFWFEAEKWEMQCSHSSCQRNLHAVSQWILGILPNALEVGGSLGVTSYMQPLLSECEKLVTYGSYFGGPSPQSSKTVETVHLTSCSMSITNYNNNNNVTIMISRKDSWRNNHKATFLLPPVLLR